jgi:hypothetical protein
MIRVQCNECRTEYRIANVQYLGAGSYVDVIVEPCCECSEEDFESWIRLQSDLQSAEEAYEELHERFEEGYREYKKILAESKELKWKRRYKALQRRMDEYVSIAEFEEGRRKEIEKEIIKMKKECNEDMDQMVANHNLAMDELQMLYKQSRFEHKKLIFEYDKLKAKVNGGKYNRSVDL